MSAGVSCAIVLTALLALRMTSTCAGENLSPIPDGFYSARSYGAKADGQTDDTGAIQQAMNAAAAQGGVVYLPPGKYMVKGSLSVPPGVTVKGAAESPQFGQPLVGSVILATGGRDDEAAPALFEMGNSCMVTGLTVYYPEQKLEDIHPYAWTFHLQGFDNTVENVTLINSYNAIRVGPEGNVRHRIRSVYGCALRRGISVDACTDIGRIDNVQLHCHWWSAPEVGGDFNKVREYMWHNCEGFTFGRTDWEYVNNTFVFPCKTGYRFIETKAGKMNGQLSGIGADECQRALVVEAIQEMGLLITNGQFVGFYGDDPTEIVIEKSAAGSVRLENCAFWGYAVQNVVCHGNVFLSLSNCFFSSWRKTDSPMPLIQADAGKLQVTNCTFGTPQPSIHLKPGLKHAIISGNNGAKGVSILNDVGDKAIIRDNEPAE